MSIPPEYICAAPAAALLIALTCFFIVCGLGERREP